MQILQVPPAVRCASVQPTVRLTRLNSCNGEKFHFAFSPMRSQDEPREGSLFARIRWHTCFLSISLTGSFTRPFAYPLAYPLTYLLTRRFIYARHEMQKLKFARARQSPDAQIQRALRLNSAHPAAHLTRDNSGNGEWFHFAFAPVAPKQKPEGFPICVRAPGCPHTHAINHLPAGLLACLHIQGYAHRHTDSLNFFNGRILSVPILHPPDVTIPMLQPL